MRALAVLAFALLAGCASHPAPSSLPAPVAEPVTGNQQVDFHLTSSLSACPPVVGGCAGVMGEGSHAFDGHNWVALDVTMTPDGGPTDPAAQTAQMRLVADCVGEHSACPSGHLAVAEGAFPLHLQASGFRVVDPNAVAFRVEYLGPLPASGSGGGYEVRGGLSYADDPVAPST